MGKAKLLLLGLAALAVLLAGCDREITGDVTLADTSDESCLECHSGLLDQAQGEWANSVHASGSNVDYTNRGDGDDCTRCHDQQGFIQFLATGMLPDEPLSTVSAIGCFTCHNPHETADLSLRTVAAYTLENGDVFDHEAGNLCANCHHSRYDATGITDNIAVHRYWGPHHGPQGDMLIGSNAWEFPGEGYDIESSPHASAVRDACAGCHMGNVEAHDGYAIGGHSWNMVDEETGSSLAALCAECHDEDDTFDVEGKQTEIDSLMAELRTLLEDQGVLSDDHPPGFPGSGPTIADRHLAGALFNFLFILEDRSRGVHNYEYAASLLEASIDYVSGLPAGSSTPPITMITAH